MKKLISLTFIFLFVIFLFGCDSNAKEPSVFRQAITKGADGYLFQGLDWDKTVPEVMEIMSISESDLQPKSKEDIMVISTHLEQFNANGVIVYTFIDSRSPICGGRQSYHVTGMKRQALRDKLKAQAQEWLPEPDNGWESWDANDGSDVIWTGADSSQVTLTVLYNTDIADESTFIVGVSCPPPAQK